MIYGPMTPKRKADALCLTGGFQDEVARWMMDCFGPEISADRLERGDRFLEEALELAQTCPGMNRERAHALVDYVFDRPEGAMYQEVGGVMVTLAALCNTVAAQNVGSCANTELERIWGKVEEIRAKQATKPVGSALPTAQAARAALTGPVESTVNERGVPVRRMKVTRELARHAIGERIWFAGKLYDQCPLGTPGMGTPDPEEFPADAWMYVIDDVATADPIITTNRWPEYVPPPSRAGVRSRFREIPLWHVNED